MKTFTCSYEVKIFKRTSRNPVWGVLQLKTTSKNMKRFQIKFSSQFLAIFLLMQTRVKSKKTCKPGQEDVTSQPFDLTARGECDIFFTFLLILEKEILNLRKCFKSKSCRNRKIDIR
jgi:hypothetical protein